MMTRAFRRVVCRALIGVMLFAQFAVAAYACAEFESSARPAQPVSSVTAQADVAAFGESGSVAATASVVGGLMDCDQMFGSLDPASPNLCAEHCRHGQQSDQTATPALPVVVLSSLYTVPAVPQASPPARSSAASDSARAAAATPLAILHCRFRD